MTLIRSIFQPKEFTGKHMLFSMVAFFGVIFTVNMIMARFAVTTWSGSGGSQHLCRKPAIQHPGGSIPGDRGQGLRCCV
jgi:hypothetical protein